METVNAKNAGYVFCSGKNYLTPEKHRIFCTSPPSLYPTINLTNRRLIHYQPYLCQSSVANIYIITTEKNRFTLRDTLTLSSTKLKCLVQIFRSFQNIFMNCLRYVLCSDSIFMSYFHQFLFSNSTLSCIATYICLFVSLSSILSSCQTNVLHVVLLVFLNYPASDAWSLHSRCKLCLYRVIINIQVITFFCSPVKLPVICKKCASKIYLPVVNVSTFSLFWQGWRPLVVIHQIQNIDISSLLFLNGSMCNLVYSNWFHKIR